MVRTQIQLTEEQARTLKKIASKRHVSIAELIRQGINALLTRPLEGADIEERKQRAIAAAGRFRSGIKDISSKHDKYLTEAFR